MSDQNKNYIKKINLNYEDGESIAEFISYERQAAIHDLINEKCIKKSNRITKFIK